MQSTAHRRRLVRRHLVVIPKAAARVCPFLAGEFTGKPRDPETGLDYFGFRYNSSTLGRWMTPDLAGNLVASPANPQSWNQYAYVRNNPVTLVDPFGLNPGDLNDCSTSAGYMACPGTVITVNGGDGAIIDTIPIPVPLGAVIGTVGAGSAPSSGSGGGGGGAPNNGPTVSHCLGAAAAYKGVSIGLDILGSIPAVGNAVSAGAGIVRAGIAVNHVITSPAFAVGSGLYGAYGSVTAGPEGATDSLVGAGSAGAGIGLVLADASLEGTKAIPIVGNFVSVATLGWDAYQAYKKYQSCMAGH